MDDASDAYPAVTNAYGKPWEPQGDHVSGAAEADAQPSLGATMLFYPIVAKRARLLTTLDRLGVAMNVGFGAIDAYPLDRLPFSWYLDFWYSPDPSRPNGVEYVQVLPVDEHYPPDWLELEEAVRANPGSLWFVGNEPEGVYVGNRTPEEYSDIYHTYYTFLKTHDPSCTVAIGSVIQPTPLRLEWLDRLLQSYEAQYGQPLPTDVWNIHNQVLREKRQDYGCGIPAGLDDDEGMAYPWWENDNVTRFQEHIVAFRQWMADRGYRDTWLIVSEFGVLYPSHWFDTLGEPGGDARVMAFMEATYDYLLSATDSEIGCPPDGNRLVQRWAWFSLNTPTWTQRPAAGFNGNLCDPYTHELTVFGEHYERLTAGYLGEATP